MSPALNSPYGNGPKDLENPVPGNDLEKENEAVVGAKANLQAPSAPPAMQQQQAQPQPQEQQSAQPQFSPDELAAIEQTQSVQKAQRSPHTGKTVSAKLPWGQVRVNPDDSVEVYDPKKKTWGPMSSTMREFSGDLYNVSKSMPSILGGILGGFIPGVGPIGRVAGSAAGAALGESQSGTNLQKESPALYVWRKSAGVSDDQSQVTHPALAGLAGAAGQGLGEVSGRAMGNAKASAQSQAEVMQGLQATAPLRSELAAAAQANDIPMTGMQLVRDLPGSQFVTKPEIDLMKGVAANPSQSALLEQFYQKQQQAIYGALQDQVSKVAPNVDFSNLDIQAVTQAGSGQRPLNLFGRIEKAYQSNVAVNRAAVSELAGDREFDPTPIVSKFEDSLKGFFKYDATLFDPDGSINTTRFKQLVGNEGYSDPALKDFKNLYMTLKNAQNRIEVSRPFRAQMEATGNNFGLDPEISQMMLQKQTVSSDLKGLSFDQLSSFNDALQRFAAYDSPDRTPFQKEIGKVAHQGRLLEDDVTAKLFLDNNQPKMAARVIQSKQEYANNIDSIRQFDDLVSKNPDNAAEAIFNLPSGDFKKAVSLLSDSQLKELKGSLLMNGLSDAVSKDFVNGSVNQVSGSKLFARFFNDPQMAQKFSALYGDADTKNINQLVGLARVAELKAGNQSTSEAAADKALPVLVKLAKSVGSVRAVAFMKGLFSNNPTARDVIETSFPMVMDRINQREQAMKSRSALLEGAQTFNRVAGTPALKATAIGVAKGQAGAMMRLPKDTMQMLLPSQLDVDVSDLETKH
jgi:hypothetical protein